MTEAEWLACTDPGLMLAFLRGKASDRKLRLFACACCRRHRSVLRGERNRRVLEAAEGFADGRVGRKDLEGVRRRWYTFDHPFPLTRTWQMALSYATMTHSTPWAAETAAHAAGASGRPDRERLVQADLLRDAFGNPFRPPAVEPSWLAWGDGTVPQLARGVYDDRAFDRLPILADALEDAGCHDADVLGHCRRPGQHIRGCWVVDALTGRC
jgi:hypothetical protein